MYRLPPSDVQLAREGRKTPEFKRLVADLFGNTPEEGLLYDSADTLALLLDKSGYYHALKAGESTQPYRERIADRIQYGERERHWMWLLGGCEFDRSFRILDFSVEPFTGEQLNFAFGDQEREKKRWWLVLREKKQNGWVGKQEWERKWEKKEREEAPKGEKEMAELMKELEQRQKRP